MSQDGISRDSNAPACPACGASEPGEKFCMACGEPLGQTPANVEQEAPPTLSLQRCRRCGGTSPVGDKFCLWCGTSFGPRPPFKFSRSTKRVLALAALAACLLFAVGAAFYVNWIVTPERARLVVWFDYWADWQLTLDDGRTLRVLEESDIRLPAGEYTLFADPRPRPGQYAPGPEPESIKLRLESGRLYLYQVGGKPLSVVARHGGQTNQARLVGPVGRPLWAEQEELRAETTSSPGTDWVPASAELENVPSTNALDATDGACLLVVNPYDEPLRVRATLPDVELAFVLPGGGVRCLPASARKPISLSVSLRTEETVVEEQSVEPREGLSLYTIGRATCYAWRREGATVDDLPTPLAPEFLLSLATDKGDAFELCRANDEPGSYRGTLEGAILTRTTAAGERAQLVPLASAPLFAAKPRPLPDATTHPEVRVKELPAAESLRERPIESISVHDGLFGLVEGIPHDLASGERLCESGVPLVAAAVSSRGLVGVTRLARLAQVNEGRVTTSANLIDPTLLAWSGPGRGEVYLYGGQAVGGLYAVRDGRWRRVLDATHQLSAVGSIERGLLVAQGRTIERLSLEAGQPQLIRILELPPGPPIIGVHDAEGLLVFATDDCVSMYTGGVVLPLVVGIGGPLAPYRGGLVVHDRQSRRLVLVESSLFAAKQVADSGVRP